MVVALRPERRGEATPFVAENPGDILFTNGPFSRRMPLESSESRELLMESARPSRALLTLW
eukprot:CAMPEP_0184493272 /NCGR_PEP_ID=MMETSP0113_2-20130426/25533_1 /TAXON_ID=91329 /ORGANISM="Norrisiella sphaerica, Strain BC52" /LENGTH=60 /DNA_ID=CAMNT_0026878475 /DNA_START=12 /DNA_END=191 /DNA_ORIENTATION=+